MDLMYVLFFVVGAGHCLSTYAFGLLRTKQFGTKNVKNTSNTKPFVSNPDQLWQTLWKRNTPSSIPDNNIRTEKRFFEFSPILFEDRISEQANSKRYFQYSPFITHFKHRQHPINPTSKSKPIRPFVDHFSGVRSWALQFYKPKAKPNTDLKKINDAFETNSFNTDESKDDEMYIQEEKSTEINTPGSVTEGIVQREKQLQEIEDLLKGDILKLNERSKWENENADVMAEPFVDLNYEKLNDLGIADSVDDKQDNGFDSFGGFATDTTSNKDLFEIHDLNTYNKTNKDPQDTNFESKKQFPQFEELEEMGFGDVLDQHEQFQDTFENINRPPFDDNSKPHFGFEFETDTNNKGQHGFGSFSTDDSVCKGIEYRPCLRDDDCSCNGFYFCIEGTCNTVKASDTADYVPDAGMWHEGPVLLEEPL